MTSISRELCDLLISYHLSLSYKEGRKDTAIPNFK